MFEYYFTIMHNKSGFEKLYTGVCYKLDYKLDSIENMIKLDKRLENDGYKNAVILFYKQLNE